MIRIGLLLKLYLTVLLASFSSIIFAAEHPPAVNRGVDVHERLENAYNSKGPNYSPRTNLMDGQKAKYVNRLIEEASPYLLQHAHNPVDWRSWSQDTLLEAVIQNKPIFLSVGYATCHWCHVMERESFDQEDVALILNKNFIPVKIDREQSPDLDRLYITATQLQNGQSGWPNTLWLTPDGRPFHTGTYFTKDDLIQTSLTIVDAWQHPDGRKQIEEVATGLSGAIRKLIGVNSNTQTNITDVTYSRASNALLSLHNELEGGFSEVSQFPQEAYLLYLLDHWRRGSDEANVEAVFNTLNAILAGGIQDHVGGGFHRYTIDPAWSIPHFEKMLYNQALLSRVLIEAWEIKPNATYKRAVERTFQYVIRDMKHSSGAFFSAEDAESLNNTGELEEGAFYNWTSKEFLSVDGQSKQSAKLFGIDPTASESEEFVLRLNSLDDLDFDKLDKSLSSLLAARNKRNKPLRDEKIIAGWNGLMIRSLAEGSLAFSNPEYATIAAKAGNAIWQKLWDGKRLRRFWYEEKIEEKGLLEDYAWLALGYVALSDATGDKIWNERAVLLTNTMWQLFNGENGRLKSSEIDGPLGSLYDATDGATPSAEASALELSTLLTARTGNLQFFSNGEKLKNGLSTAMDKEPKDMPYALMASRFAYDGTSLVRQTRANGKVKIHLTANELILDIADGWHISANVPDSKWVIPSSIKGAVAKWPEGDIVKLGFSKEQFKIYEGRIFIPIKQNEEIVELTIQACSNEICLQSEKATFRRRLN